MTARHRFFTPKELKEFDGKAGRPAYVAFKGKVYDVSGSRLWTEGNHRGRHFAGDDLTNGIVNAPHGEEALIKSPIVGELREEAYTDRLVKRLEGLHLHSMLVHFSVAFSYVTPLLAILYILTGETSFEKASYYLLTLGFIAAPFSGLSGVFSWKVTYEGRQTRMFTRKAALTIALVAVITVCFVWRTAVPDVLVEKTYLGYFYLALLVCLVPITTLLGHYGGKIVYS